MISINLKVEKMDIEKAEFWGTTKPSMLASFGFLLGSISCLLALHINSALLVVSVLCLGAIIYALIIDYRKGFSVRWRLANFIIHLLFLITLIIGIPYVLFKSTF